MNVLFLTMSPGMENIEVSGIYTDLMRKFRDEGHDVYIIYPRERRLRLQTSLKEEGRVHTLGVKTLNLTKTNLFEKGLGQLLVECQYKRALRTHFGHVKFDLILYSTPPITFINVIRFAQKNNPKALTYLMLKDIFPQNAVDMGMLTKHGLKGIIYKFFRHKEKELYKISDHIGCMSPANVKFVLEHNPYLDPSKLEIAPNSYDLPHSKMECFDKKAIRLKYGLPADKPIFVYGGNMGRPQGIPFLLECIKVLKDRDNCHFVIVGDGTEYVKLNDWVTEVKPKAVSLFKSIPKVDYDNLIEACDVGLVFLDYKFSIPNYPSRLLPYIMKKKPIIAATDPNSDVGSIAVANGYGFWVPSNSVDKFVEAVDRMLDSNIQLMGERGYEFYRRNYTTGHTYNAIMQHFINL